MEHLKFSMLGATSACALTLLACLHMFAFVRGLDQGTVWYVLSTLAQTCAALAAFVGAVGLFRLQVLREQHRAAERDLRGWAELLVAQDFNRTPMVQLLDRVAQAEQGASLRVLAYLETTLEARRRWAAFGPLLRNSRRALVIFEGWNVAVIALSLLGFNFMRWLTGSPWVVWGLVLIVAGTAFVTMYCVVVWTRGVET